MRYRRPPNRGLLPFFVAPITIREFADRAGMTYATAVREVSRLTDGFLHTNEPIADDATGPAAGGLRVEQPSLFQAGFTDGPGRPAALYCSNEGLARGHMFLWHSAIKARDWERRWAEAT